MRAAPAPRGLAAAWPVERLDLALIVVDVVDSTQRLARTLLDRLRADDELPPPTLIVAVAQSAGRGRRGRAWSSSPGLGLWATLLFATDTEALPSLPARAALALGEMIARELPSLRIKWPNDFVVGRRKLGGLLVDAVQRPGEPAWALLGFGLDLAHGHADLPGDYATSLALERTSAVPDLAIWTARSASALWPRVAAVEDDWLARYAALSAHSAGDALACDLETGTIEGRFAGFANNGGLLIDTAGGRRSISAGEVFAW